MIIDAKNRPFAQMNLSIPNISGALDNWFQQLKMSVVTKTIINMIVTEVLTEQTIMAVRQPLSARQLYIKPEGQRGWNWETLHVKGENTNFQLDSVVVFNGIRYRVMQKNEWQEYGYVEYHITQDFTHPDITKSINESISVTDDNNVEVDLAISESVGVVESKENLTNMDIQENTTITESDVEVVIP
jgi:hypothetical protein